MRDKFCRVMQFYRSKKVFQNQREREREREREKKKKSERAMRKRRMCGNPIYVLKEGEWWAFKRKTQHMQAHGDNGPPPKP